MSFEALLKALDTTQEALKAAPAAAAAEPGKTTNGAGTGEGEEVLKSFAFTLEDGTVIEAADGTELVKSLVDRQGSFEKASQGLLAKCVEVIGEQSVLIKSMQADIAKLSGEGRGRRAVVTVADPKVLAKSDKGEDKGLSAEEFLVKAEAALGAGRITGRDLAVAEGCLNSGAAVPAHIVSRVTAA